MLDSKNAQNVDYITAGFDNFLQRSIDGTYPDTLSESLPGQMLTRELNYDLAQVSGSFGDTVRIGFINLEGSKGRITISDEDGTIPFIMGELDG